MKKSSLIKLTLGYSSLLGLTACAGPHTPLGSLFGLTPGQILGEAETRETGPGAGLEPRLEITPGKQVLHGPSRIRVTIHDPEGEPVWSRLSVRYNGLDVSRSFVRQSRIIRDPVDHTLIVDNPVVKLPADSDHLIEFSYQGIAGRKVLTRYESPVCFAFRPQKVVSTGAFRPSRVLLAMIASISEQEGFNPAFLTGLIAQESRFKTDAVSWAKAVGLTQVTNVAAKEISQTEPDWPRYPGTDEMSPELLKTLIFAGVIHSKNEWRLDSKRSIQGGVIYARMLAERWSTYENLNRIRRLFPDSEVALTQLILASYHSGYSRVQNALARYGANWLKSPDLGEARKYVNRIFSYCNHFVEREVRRAQTS